nr:MAG TPA: hypothetical protein [Caudoviricetes sp.]
MRLLIFVKERKINVIDNDTMSFMTKSLQSWITL